MPTRTFLTSRIPRLAPLATCLAAALGLTLSTAQADDRSPAWGQPVKHRSASAFELPAYLREHTAEPHSASKHTSNRQPTPRVVDTCADDLSPGSLREQVYAAMSGETIDLSTLTCSTITLDPARTPPEIEVNQDSLYLKGPAEGAASLTIDGGHHSRIFQHFGTRTLGLSNLTISNGYYSSGNYANGGCISSSGDVTLMNSIVSHCALVGTSNSIAAGGGVYVKGTLTLSGSTITDNSAYATGGGFAFGGGAYALNGLLAKYSTISNNEAFDDDSDCASGAGGVAIHDSVNLLGSTISGNHSCHTGGLWFEGNAFATSSLTNSTISRNVALSTSHVVGGILAGTPLSLTNTTVAFNYSGSETGGLFALSNVKLESSIIADNVAANVPSDLSGEAGVMVAGSDNLIVSSSLSLPSGTRQECPQLELLANNGGLTQTHALRHTSPAIDHGNNAGNLVDDQRFAPRVAGAMADIGSVEWQPGETDERVFVNGFDGLCDQ